MYADLNNLFTFTSRDELNKLYYADSYICNKSDI